MACREQRCQPRLGHAGPGLAMAMAMAMAMALAASASARAATVQVTVLAADGKPLADAVVEIEPKAPGTPRRPAPVQTTIQQEKMRFVPALIVVPAGSRVRFTNLDNYEHHVRGRPANAGLQDATPASSGFEMRLAAATEGRAAGSQEVVVTQPGAVELGCHLHSVMRGHIFVAGTPWVAKTDANGNATLGDVPEGAAQVRVWHGDQLLPAAPVATTVVASTVLNLNTQVLPRGKGRR